MRRIQSTNRSYFLILKRVALVLGALGVLTYIIFHLQNLFTGPEISIISPQNGGAATSLATVAGTAERAEQVTINGNRVFMDAQKRFSFPILLLPGYNVVTVHAVDRFGKEKTEHVTVIGPALQ